MFEPFAFDQFDEDFILIKYDDEYHVLKFISRDMVDRGPWANVKQAAEAKMTESNFKMLIERRNLTEA